LGKEKRGLEEGPLKKPPKRSKKGNLEKDLRMHYLTMGTGPATIHAMTLLEKTRGQPDLETAKGGHDKALAMEEERKT